MKLNQNYTVLKTTSQNRDSWQANGLFFTSLKNAQNYYDGLKDKENICIVKTTIEPLN